MKCRRDIEEDCNDECVSSDSSNSALSSMSSSSFAATSSSSSSESESCQNGVSKNWPAPFCVMPGDLTPTEEEKGISSEPTGFVCPTKLAYTDIDELD